MIAALDDPVLGPINRARIADRLASAPEPAADLRLFCYGTLRPGRSNAHMLEFLGGIWTPGHIEGSVDTCDRPPHTGLPALRVGPPGRAEGEILAAPGLAGFWSTLDAFEGADYVRLLVPVDTGAPAPVIASAYAFRPFLAP